MSSRKHAALFGTAFFITGLSMRTAVTSVGAVLDALQRDLHVSSSVAGAITTLPVICFAGVGALTPRLARGFGMHRLLVVALVLGAAGLALRPIGSSAVWFALLSLCALAAGAVSNVLMPSLVKEHFPDDLGLMTAVYVTALATGATAGAGLTVPVGDATGGWRLGLGFWALPCLLAVLPWLPTLHRDHAAADPVDVRIRPTALIRSRTAWALVVFFAMQSVQAYIAFGWFARFLDDHGISPATSGAMVAVFTAVGIPVSFLAPRAPAPHLFAASLGLGACTLVAYVGMAVAPVDGAWVWMVLAGIGGGTFPISLVLIGLRSRTPATTAALSAFVQVIGYVVAGTGPLLFGALFGATGSWGAPLAVLFAALGLTMAAAWPSTADRYVDDELAA